MIHEKSGQVVVVGGGHAGGRLAQRLRAKGFDGRLTIVGDEAHLPYERPPLSKGLLTGTTAIRDTFICHREWYEANGIALRLGTCAAGIDRSLRRLVLESGACIHYDTLVLASGARPRRLAVAGSDHPSVLTLRTLNDAERLRGQLLPGKRVAIVGAGLIGLEIASTASELGCRPFIVEASDRAIGRVVPVGVSAFFAELLARNRVPIYYHTTISGFCVKGAELILRLAGGVALTCDIAVVGIGVDPNCEIAANAGLEVANGIVTDEMSRTNDPRIFAIGDVACVRAGDNDSCARSESWHNAETQADRLAELIHTGRAAPASEAHWFWTSQFGLNVQFVGTASGVDEVLWCRAPDFAKAVGIYIAHDKVVGGVSVSDPRAMRQIRRWVTPGCPATTRAEAAAFVAELHS